MRKERSSKNGNENTASQAVGSTLNPIGADKEGGNTENHCSCNQDFQADRKRVTEGNEDVSGTPEA